MIASRKNEHAFYDERKTSVHLRYRIPKLTFWHITHYTCARTICHINAWILDQVLLKNIFFCLITWSALQSDYIIRRKIIQDFLPVWVVFEIEQNLPSFHLIITNMKLWIVYSMNAKTWKTKQSLSFFGMMKYKIIIAIARIFSWAIIFVCCKHGS